MADAITRVSYYFPTHALCAFQILTNLVINDSSSCSGTVKGLVVVILVIMCFITLFSAFTDTYTTTTGRKRWVFLIPLYGPVCWGLPTEYDMDRVWDFYFLRPRDWVHGLLAVACFVLLSLFTNPVCMCLFPSGLNDGTSRYDASIVRTVPIVVSLISGMLMMCLGPPRQMMGYQNIPDTVPAAEVKPYPREPSIMTEDEYSERDMNMRASQAKGIDYDYPPPRSARASGVMQPRESYQSSAYRDRGDRSERFERSERSERSERMRTRSDRDRSGY